MTAYGMGAAKAQNAAGGESNVVGGGGNNFSGGGASVVKVPLELASNGIINNISGPYAHNSGINSRSKS